jgi:hypothetical protein
MMQAKTTPGWRTSEYWLNVAVVIYNTLLTSGVIHIPSKVVEWVSVAATVLLALGYTWARSFVKANQPPA